MKEGNIFAMVPPSVSSSGSNSNGRQPHWQLYDINDKTISYKAASTSSSNIDINMFYSISP